MSQQKEEKPEGRLKAGAKKVVSQTVVSGLTDLATSLLPPEYKVPVKTAVEVGTFIWNSVVPQHIVLHTEGSTESVHNYMPQKQKTTIGPIRRQRSRLAPRHPYHFYDPSTSVTRMAAANQQNMEVDANEQAQERERRHIHSQPQILIGPSSGGSGSLRQVSPVTIYKQKTLQHYLVLKSRNNWQSVAEGNGTDVVYPNFNAAEYYNEDWAWLPYTWLCSYMSMRDYQGLNINYKKWRVKSIHVHAHHMVPFIDDVKAVSGNTSPSLEISPLDFFEAFVDSNHELPYFEVTESHLPNSKMDVCHDSRQNATLKTVKLRDWNYPSDLNTFELEQSPGYKFINCADGFEVHHEFHPVDLQWRSALIPNDFHWKYMKNNYDLKDGYISPLLGPRNAIGGLLGQTQKLKEAQEAQRNLPSHNAQLDSMVAHYPHDPPPHILFRIPQIERTSGAQVSYGFTFWCTYSIEIEAIPNTICTAPLVFTKPTKTNLFANDNEANQSSGSALHNMTTMRIGQNGVYHKKETFETN